MLLYFLKSICCAPLVVSYFSIYVCKQQNFQITKTLTVLGYIHTEAHFFHKYAGIYLNS